MQFSMQTVLGLVTILAFSGVVFSCPEGHGCFRYPEGCGPGAAMCDLLVAWQANDADGIDFVARAKHTGTDPRWMGIGFSLDGDMGEDDILICRQTTTLADVVLEHYWSPGQTIVKETTDPISEDGLTNTKTLYEDGYINCNFTRAISVAGKDHIYDLSETTAADMMPKYYWFFGTGPVVSNAPNQHEKDPYHSALGINYTQTGDIMVEEGSSSESHEDAASGIIASVTLLLAMICLAIYVH